MFIFRQRIAVNCTELIANALLKNGRYIRAGWKGLYEEKNPHRVLL
jgi:hypothetical protein